MGLRLLWLRGLCGCYMAGGRLPALLEGGGWGGKRTRRSLCWREHRHEVVSLDAQVVQPWAGADYHHLLQQQRGPYRQAARHGRHHRLHVQRSTHLARGVLELCVAVTAGRGCEGRHHASSLGTLWKGRLVALRSVCGSSSRRSSKLSTSKLDSTCRQAGEAKSGSEPSGPSSPKPGSTAPCLVRTLPIGPRRLRSHPPGPGWHHLRYLGRIPDGRV